MSILIVIIILVIFSVAVWALVTYLPLPALLKKVIIGVATVGAIIWLLQVFGLFKYLLAVKI